MSQHVAVAVGREAQRCGLIAPLTDHELAQRIDAAMWAPKYLQYRRIR